MPEIAYQELDRRLQADEKLPSRGVFLIWGNEALCSRALEKIAATLLPDGRRNPAFETLDGSDANVPLAIERVGTYALLSQGRIVVLSDSSVFHGRQDRGELLEKAAVAFADGRMKQAADWLLKLLAVENLGLDDISVKTIRRLRGSDGAEEDLAWVMDLVDYCREQGLEVPAATDAAGLLKGAVEKGFPRGNYLIVTCAKVRKTTSFYRVAKKQGLIIDCSVPGSGRSADKNTRRRLLRRQAEEILAQAGKRMAPDALAAVEEMTGFDLRTFSHSLEKLISYTGGRPHITRDDVEQAISRSRRDPIYEFTGAVFKRQLDRALFYLKSLLGEGMHPLALLAALVNQLRRLMLIKGFSESRQGACWQPGMPFSRFQAVVLPAVKEQDAALQAVVASWPTISAAAEGKAGGKKGPPKRAGSSDLLLFGKGTSPYALYMRFKESEAFSMQEMVQLLQKLRMTETELKTSSRAPSLLLEDIVVSICSPPGAAPKQATEKTRSR